MELAGKAVADAVLRRQPKNVWIVCGKGNNGGDGWVAARWLTLQATSVHVLSLVDPETLTGEAAAAFRSAQAVGVPFSIWPETGKLAQADLIVDAMLGTGSGRAPEGSVLAAIVRIAQMSVPVLAIDVPTGVDASTGEVPGKAVRADETITMGYVKLGLMVTPGALYAGKVEVADIGIRAPSMDGLARMATAQQVHAWLPKRTLESHKGTFGRVGILRGEMTGAAMLAGLGAARAGAGLVVMVGSGTSADVPYAFVQRDTNKAAKPFADCGAIVLGPGLGLERAHTAAFVEGFAGTGVLDADALHLEVLPADLGARFVLTPHPKECARLLGWTVQAVNERRIEAARAVAKSRGAVVVLKGYRSIVAAPTGALWVNPTGGPALATAGSGDVLAGIIGGLLAQGLQPLEAAIAGAWIHGRAGDLAGRTLHPASVLATDVVDAISRAIPLHFDTDSEEAPSADE